jgi:hypothetical protein
LTGIEIQIEGKFFREFSRGLDDMVLKDGPGVAVETDRVDSVSAMHSWVELASRVVVVRGLCPFFVLEKRGFLAQGTGNISRTLKKYGSR